MLHGYARETEQLNAHKQSVFSISDLVLRQCCCHIFILMLVEGTTSNINLMSEIRFLQKVCLHETRCWIVLTNGLSVVY